MVLRGESLHALGREGAQRAKRWLEGTTRADAPWVNPDHAGKLTFPWADGPNYSFDLGGRLRGGDLDKREFFAECKYYSNVGDQPGAYKEYIAKCFRAYMLLPERCDVFMWITWHPFSLGAWARLRTPGFVETCVKAARVRVFGDGATDDDVENGLNERSSKVASRLWLLVLCSEHEGMIPTPEHRGVIEQHIVEALT